METPARRAVSLTVARVVSKFRVGTRNFLYIIALPWWPRYSSGPGFGAVGSDVGVGSSDRGKGGCGDRGGG
jgi:hypothetical protein